MQNELELSLVALVATSLSVWFSPHSVSMCEPSYAKPPKLCETPQDRLETVNPQHLHCALSPVMREAGLPADNRDCVPITALQSAAHQPALGLYRVEVLDLFNGCLGCRLDVYKNSRAEFWLGMRTEFLTISLNILLVFYTKYLCTRSSSQH